MYATATPLFDQHETERRAIDPALLNSEKFKSAILTAALDCIISIDQAGTVFSFNRAAERTFGYREAEMLGKRLTDTIIPPESREPHRACMERLLSTDESRTINRHIELTAIHADGTRFPIELAVVPLSIGNRSIFAVFIRDITERKRTEALQLGQNHILNMVATGVSLPDILAEIARFADNQSGRNFCSITHLKADGRGVAGRIAPGLPSAFAVELDNAMAESCDVSCDTASPRGAPVTAMDIATDPTWPATRALELRHGLCECGSWPIFGKNRTVVGTLALYSREPVPLSNTDLQLIDICTKLAGIAIESRTAEERIRHLAHYDGLTSLPNRFLFQEYLDLALRNARSDGEKFAVLFLDLDKFKEINDTLGHDAGDLVLREMANRLRGCLRHADKIARMGGDEFYVLIEKLRDSSDAAEVAKKLLDATARPVYIEDQAYSLSVSIGIAVYPEDGGNGQTLIKNADDAMYRAKERGKNAFQFFSSQPASTDPDMPLPGPVTLLRTVEKKLMCVK